MTTTQQARQLQRQREAEFDALVTQSISPSVVLSRRTIAHRRAPIRRVTMFKFFKKVTPTGMTHDFTEHAWGHNIEVTNLIGRPRPHDKIKGHGWGADRRPGEFLIPLGGDVPRVGDRILLRSSLEDGTYRYLLTKVERVRDPRDMFFFEGRLDFEGKINLGKK